MGAKQTLAVDFVQGVATVIIDRQSKLNALSALVLRELIDLASELAADRAIRGVMLLGAGGRAFVAGADVPQMSVLCAEEGAAFGRLGQRAMDAIEALPMPVIACVDGVALGGGCELALAADFIYATERSTFGLPQVGLGMIPGFGGCVRLPRAIGPARAKELIYSGRTITARDAFAIGLVNRVCASRNELLAAARATLKEIASRSSQAVALSKQVLRDLSGKPHTEQLAGESQAFARAFASEDARDGLDAFISKRPPRFAGD